MPDNDSRKYIVIWHFLFSTMIHDKKLFIIRSVQLKGYCANSASNCFLVFNRSFLYWVICLSFMRSFGAEMLIAYGNLWCTQPRDTAMHRTPISISSLSMEYPLLRIAPMTSKKVLKSVTVIRSVPKSDGSGHHPYQQELPYRHRNSKEGLFFRP